MTVLWLLLLVAEIPTTFFNWHSSDPYTDGYFLEPSAANATTYARCFFDMKIAHARFQNATRFDSDSESSYKVTDTVAFQNMIVTFLLLVFTYITRISKILDGLPVRVIYRLRGWLGEFWVEKILLADSAFLRSRRAWSPRRILLRKYLIIRQMFALNLFCRLYADIYTSMLSEVSFSFHLLFFLAIFLLVCIVTVESLTALYAQVYWLFVSGVWAIVRLFLARTSVNIDENDMTFGQILAVLLLIAPLVPIAFAILPFIRRKRQAQISTFLYFSHCILARGPPRTVGPHLYKKFLKILNLFNKDSRLLPCAWRRSPMARLMSGQNGLPKPTTTYRGCTEPCWLQQAN